MTDDKKAGGKGKAIGIGCLIIIGVFVVLIIIGAIAGGEKKSSKSYATTSDTGTEEPAAVQADEPAAEKANSLTGPQKNAARSATQYLSMSGFSRQGLIHQLSSDAGEGYDVADATAAVDSLDVDWDAQAARSAKDYLDMTGFSCKGLIQQLSSNSGDKYTVSQATYGAKQAGAC